MRIGANCHAIDGSGHVSSARQIGHYSHRNGRKMMTALNPIQEALIPHINKATFQAICHETEELVIENTQLKARIDFLERQIATHTFGGWQTH